MKYTYFYGISETILLVFELIILMLKYAADSCTR